MKLRDAKTGKVILKNVVLADSFLKRFKGLMLKSRPARSHGLLFAFRKKGRHSVHTCFMRFAIDLVYLDDNGRIVEIKENLCPWRFYRPKSGAKYLLELPAGDANIFGLHLGQQLKIEEK